MTHLKVLVYVMKQIDSFISYGHLTLHGALHPQYGRPVSILTSAPDADE